MVDAQFIAVAGGGILYDATRLRKPVAELFSREYWAARDGLEEIAGGRSSVAILRAELYEPTQQRWVLRHYRRGGWMARLSQDRYVWTGAERTRSFAEWRLLAELHRRALPVPAPIAARYQRGVLTYCADLITELVPASRTLADSITGAALPEGAWRAVGGTIAAFHAQGVQHADLNAHNILLSSSLLSGSDAHGSPSIHVLDFDRGRIRARGSWEEAVLARLKRSLEKVRRQRRDVAFGEREWAWLREDLGP